MSTNGLAVIDLYPGSQIGSWGKLISDEGEYAFSDLYDRVERLGWPSPQPYPLMGWLVDTPGLLILGSNAVDDLLILDLEQNEVIRRHQLERDPDFGLRKMTFFALDGALGACVTECEVHAFAFDGTMKWTWNHNDLSLALTGVGSLIHLTSGMPDLDQWHDIYLDPATGVEVHAQWSDS